MQSARSSRCHRCSSKARGGSRPGPASAACWSPAMPADRDLRAEQLGCDHADYARSRARSRQHGARHVEDPQQSSSHSPVARSISMVREAFVRSVTCTRAAGEIPDQPGIDRCRRAISPSRALRARVGTCSQNPADLAGGKVGVDHQARSCARSAPHPRSAPVPRRSPPCAGIARRWRAPPAARSRGPRRQWSRAGW